MSNTATKNRVVRDARLQWVPIALMGINPRAQRDLDAAWVDHLAVNFDPEEIGTLTVNKREGAFYIIDGQHRKEAMCKIGYDDQQIQCWVYEGLTETEEAEKFLKLNNSRSVHAFAKFKVGVVAGRGEEEAINRVVRAQDLVVSQDKTPGAIAAVGTLRRVYRRSDANTLGRTLRIVRDAYGDPGLQAPVIDGIGHLCQRYNGSLDDDQAVERLSRAFGGVNGLLGRATTIRLQTGNNVGLCVAAAAVAIINTGRGGKKLPAWWKGDD